MTTQDEQSLKNEIQHIFDSGANEVRILEMVKSFIEKRRQALYIHDVSNQRELLFAFIKDWKEEFKDENWDYLDFMAERFLGKQ